MNEKGLVSLFQNSVPYYLKHRFWSIVLIESFLEELGYCYERKTGKIKKGNEIVELTEKDIYDMVCKYYYQTEKELDGEPAPFKYEPNDIIVDFEFTSLPRENCGVKKSEIFQFKALNVSNGKSICVNYNYNPKCLTASAIVCYGCIPERGSVYFSKKEFEKALNEIGANKHDRFFGFSIKADELILSEKYSVSTHSYTDIQDELRLTELEVPMAEQGCSLEACYYLITKTVKNDTHNGAEELGMIKALYDYAASSEKKEFYTVFPWGDFAGMSIEDYCNEYRRKADGYRYNNCDKLADSLDNCCERIDNERFGFFNETLW